MSKRSLSSKVKAALKELRRSQDIEVQEPSAPRVPILSEQDIMDWGHLINVVAKIISVPAESVEARLIIVLIGALLSVRYRPAAAYALIREAFPKELALALLLLKDEAREMKLGKPVSH